ncbi:MAG TPA: potassium channel family protein [Microlunatus sp.]
MIDTPPLPPPPPRRAWTLVLPMVLRMTVSVSLLLGVYYAMPTARTREGSDLPWLVLDLCIFAILVGAQIPIIVRARYPILRAVEALGVLVPVYLVIFARIYLASSIGDPRAFSTDLDQTTALYFTVTVFATVGFGDIVAQSDRTMLLVTTQMLLNLAILGLMIRLLTGAARRGVARRGQPTLPGKEDGPRV